MLNNLIKQCASQGISVCVCKAETLTATDEDLLWSLGLLGTLNLIQLLNTVVFTKALLCMLGKSTEHCKGWTSTLNLNSWRILMVKYFFVIQGILASKPIREG